ncbi:hypothetical protein N9Z54_05640 [Planctomycetota bacterium]|nr:hypothetical protein [Planctomycetota bacterium]MDC1043661.1 hypothetical protein [bacterium]
MEFIASVAGLFVFGLFKLVLIRTVTRKDGAAALRGPRRGDGQRVQELEAKVLSLEAKLQAQERDRDHS